MRLPLGSSTMRRFSVFAVALVLTGCATVRDNADGFAKINPASLAAAPAKWDGR